MSNENTRKEVEALNKMINDDIKEAKEIMMAEFGAGFTPRHDILTALLLEKMELKAKNRQKYASYIAGKALVEL